MKTIGDKLKEVRKIKGLSQEELAELAKINLRTIQRVENGESEPRGNTINKLCLVLDLNVEDLLDYGKEEDNNYLVFFHLSVMSTLFIPLGNIILPYILWTNKKNKVIGLNRIGANLLNFQIILTAISTSITLGSVFFKLLFHGSPTIVIGMATGLITYYSGTLILPIIFAIRTRNGKASYYPNICRIIKG